MRLDELRFDLPKELSAIEPPEHRGIERDMVRLMVSEGPAITDSTFIDLANYLRPGDLLVVNRSSVIRASLPAIFSAERMRWNLSTSYGPGMHLAELRYSYSRQGPVGIVEGDMLEVAGMRMRYVRDYPGIPRLGFYSAEGDISPRIEGFGEAIRYGYIEHPWPLHYYSTIFSRYPGSSEMPSAARPFSQRVLASLHAKGVAMADIVLHCGVSSLEVESDPVEAQPLYPEPYHVPPDTADAVNTTLRHGRRVIAVGTSVVRALESAWSGCAVHPSRGFTRVFLSPIRGLNVVSGLVTGFHEPKSSHLALLRSFMDQSELRMAYNHAIRERYLWHEFGDSHLILPGDAAQN